MQILPKSLLGAATLLHWATCSNAASVLPNARRDAGSDVDSDSLRRLTYDFVIVGAGPGGLVMANRLTEDPHTTVAVIEAGTWVEDVVGNLSSVPGYNGVFDLVSPSSQPTGVDWGFITTPQPGLNGEQLRYVRGKCLGGSTNLNAMAWSHSSAGAFQKWADEVGDRTWEYETVSKYYRKAMNFTPPADTRRANATPLYDPAVTSVGGPLSVSYPAYAYSWTTWLAAGLDAVGVKNTYSFINGALNGSAWQTNTINHTTGKRASADQAYLRPYLQRQNLHIYNGTLAERILFNRDKTAVGVAASSLGKNFTLSAKREVIVSAGAFQSPQLLQVSGVGPKALLESHNIPVIADRPGVGQNLQDQFFFGLSYRVSSPAPTNDASDVTAFINNATGPLTNPGGEYAGFEKLPQSLKQNFSQATTDILSKYPADWPEAEYLTLPLFVGNLRDTPSPNDTNSYATILSTLQVPTSRGNVSISSASMHDAPLINPNWLATDSDMEVSVAMFRRLRQIWTAPVMSNVTIGDEYFPGPAIQTDQQIAQWIRANAIQIYHAAATNKMGIPDDKMAVVNPQGEVYGVKNLRVVDVSAFPFLFPGTAPQAGVYMLAEKIADDVKRSQR